MEFNTKLIKKINIPLNLHISFDASTNTLIFQTNKQQIKNLKIPEFLNINIHNSLLMVYIKSNCKLKKSYLKAQLGLYNALIQQIVYNLKYKSKIILEINGIGYKVEQKNSDLKFKLGFSHDILLNIPKTINATILNTNNLILSGNDKVLVSQFAEKIRKLKTVEPYKGKGIYLKNSIILRKDGKKNKK